MFQQFSHTNRKCLAGCRNTFVWFSKAIQNLAKRLDHSINTCSSNSRTQQTDIENILGIEVAYTNFVTYAQTHCGCRQCMLKPPPHFALHPPLFERPSCVGPQPCRGTLIADPALLGPPSRHRMRGTGPQQAASVAVCARCHEMCYAPFQT